MNYFWLDANAIAKRYVVEKGSSLIDHLFSQVSADRVICLFDSMDEARFVLVKKKNQGAITNTTFNQAIQQFELEIVNSTEILQVHATIVQKETARKLIHNYPINSTDAYILQCALDKANDLRLVGNDLFMVSSDKRLINAAKRERILTFNPETDIQQTLDTIINAI
ncbi:type II toxin-antitoxin system VapC family toxin [Candidatus Poribacteria bacterium]|nr:type II toxin-antitoxin system VapC family toxin [Candidatus Poribacteria bacterium]